jgi:putative transposase
VWTDKNRARYNRDHLRYPSELTDDEWGYVEPLIPSAKRGGGKRRTDMRAVMNGVMCDDCPHDAFGLARAVLWGAPR